MAALLGAGEGLECWQKLLESSRCSAVALAQAGAPVPLPVGAGGWSRFCSAAGGQPGGCGCNRLPAQAWEMVFSVCCSWDHL